MTSERFGPRSITVPGAVAGWAMLAERHGRLGLNACLEDAIELAREGFAVAPRCAASWAHAPNLPDGFAPAAPCGSRVRLPELGETLATIAREGADGFYGGRVGEAICSASWLEDDDLSGFRARVTTPLATTYEDHVVLELPPPTQGIAVLEGLALLALTNGTQCGPDQLLPARARGRVSRGPRRG